VEFAALLPLIMLLIMGIIEVGRVIEVSQILNNAAREGARQASTGQVTNSQVKTIVTQYVSVAGLNTTGMNVDVADITSTGTDVSQANYLDRITVSATFPYANASWSFVNYILPAGFTVSTQVEWISVRDKPFPNFPTPPVG
jgi:Flp pilus assembly protein TadG